MQISPRFSAPYEEPSLPPKKEPGPLPPSKRVGQHPHHGRSFKRNIPGIGQGWYDNMRAGPSLKCGLAFALVLMESAPPGVELRCCRGGGSRGGGDTESDSEHPKPVQLLVTPGIRAQALANRAQYLNYSIHKMISLVHFQAFMTNLWP